MEDCTMIVKYDFLSKVDGEKTEVEVDESLAKLIEQMDTDDFNLNRAETRRHAFREGKIRRCAACKSA